MALGVEDDESNDDSPTLEMPQLKDGEIDRDKMWQYRAKSVPEPRPILTGDVFFGVELEGADEQPAGVIVLQHPCALRTNGFDLRPRVLVARIDPGLEMKSLRDWQGHYNLMSLPGLFGKRRTTETYTVYFDDLYLATPVQLKAVKRIACMQVAGIALLMQRFNFHNSRLAVPTPRFRTAFGAQYAEADGIEDYCKKRSQAGVKRPVAEKEAVAWLDAKSEDTGYPRRELLELPKNRKPLISRMSDVAEDRNAEDARAKAAKLAAAPPPAEKPVRF